MSPFDHFTQDSLVWTDGHEEKISVVIFCTGFKASLRHLEPLNIITKEGKVDTEGTKARYLDGLWLVGYGNWTGFASATLIGVGRSAKSTVEEIGKYVAALKQSQHS
jgi:putative flavoprotein involved in K+ transport